MARKHFCSQVQNAWRVLYTDILHGLLCVLNACIDMIMCMIGYRQRLGIRIFRGNEGASRMLGEGFVSWPERHAILECHDSETFNI